MTSLPILLGEAPSRSGDRYHNIPLSGAVAETLCKLGGIAPQEEGSRYGRWTWALYDHYECHNLIKRWPGKQGDGSSFPLDVARQRAEVWRVKHEGRIVVMLGARLPRAFGIWTADSTSSFYHWSTPATPDGWPLQIAVIPHPSGLNRMLNDPAERQRCGEVLREARMRAAYIGR